MRYFSCLQTGHIGLTLTGAPHRALARTFGTQAHPAAPDIDQTALLGARTAAACAATRSTRATRQIAADDSLAGTKVVILTTFETGEYVYQALRAGASGFLVKDAEREELIRAVRVVHRGKALLSPSVTRRLIAPPRRRTRIHRRAEPAPFLPLFQH